MIFPSEKRLRRPPGNGHPALDLEQTRNYDDLLRVPRRNPPRAPSYSFRFNRRTNNYKQTKTNKTMFTFLYLRLRLRLILITPSREKRNDKMYHFLTEWPCRYLAMGWCCNATAKQWQNQRELQLDRALNATNALIRLMTDITRLATRCQEGYVFDGICGITMLKEFRWGNGKAGFDHVLYLQHDDPGFAKPMTHNDYECPTMMATILSGSYGHILEMRELERQDRLTKEQPVTQQRC